jgi:hypothetical protein
MDKAKIPVPPRRRIVPMRRFLLPLILLAASTAHGQFVYPKASDNVQKKAGTYAEDPFITEYRQKFFAALRGDFKTFNAGFAEIEAMVKKNPRDARALVWLGNGQTIKAIVRTSTWRSPCARRTTTST